MLELNHLVFAIPSKNPPKGLQLYLTPAKVIFYSINEGERVMNKDFWTHYDLFICSTEDIEVGDEYLIPYDLQQFGKSKRYREGGANCFKVVKSTVNSTFSDSFLNKIICSHFGSKELPLIEIPESDINLELKNKTVKRLLKLEECTQ